MNSFGYKVKVFKRGEGIIRFCKSYHNIEQQIVSILLDLTIPGSLGGKEIIKELRKIFPELPIFVISGYADNPIIARPREFGFTASLKKPFTRNELEILLNNFVSKFDI